MQKKSTAQLEFIIIMASLMSLVALSIDAVLPALNNIALDINTKEIRAFYDKIVNELFING